MVYLYEIKLKDGQKQSVFMIKAVHAYTAIARVLCPGDDPEGVVSYKRLQKIKSIECPICHGKYHDLPGEKESHDERMFHNEV